MDTKKRDNLSNIINRFGTNQMRSDYSPQNNTDSSLSTDSDDTRPTKPTMAIYLSEVDPADATGLKELRHTSELTIFQEFYINIESSSLPSKPFPEGSIIIIPKHAHKDWEDIPVTCCPNHRHNGYKAIMQLTPRSVNMKQITTIDGHYAIQWTPTQGVTQTRSTVKFVCCSSDSGGSHNKRPWKLDIKPVGQFNDFHITTDFTTFKVKTVVRHNRPPLRRSNLNPFSDEDDELTGLLTQAPQHDSQPSSNSFFDASFATSSHSMSPPPPTLSPLPLTVSPSISIQRSTLKRNHNDATQIALSLVGTAHNLPPRDVQDCINKAEVIVHKHYKRQLLDMIERHEQERRDLDENRCIAIKLAANSITYSRRLYSMIHKTEQT